MDIEIKEQIISSNKQAIENAMLLHATQLSEQLQSDLGQVQYFTSDPFTLYNNDGNAEKAVLKTYIFRRLKPFQVVFRCQVLQEENASNNLNPDEIRNAFRRNEELAFRTLYFTATPENSIRSSQHLEIAGSIAVAPEVERLGIGSSLLSNIEEIRKTLAKKIANKNGFSLVKSFFYDQTGGKQDKGWTSQKAIQLGYSPVFGEKKTFIKVERY